MLTTEMLALLCCPICSSPELEPHIKDKDGESIQEGNLRCNKCNIDYPINLGIPDMIPHDIITSSEWVEWKHHLDYLQVRREQKTTHPKRALNKFIKSLNEQIKFAEFTNINEGTVLDIGCGSGKFRLKLDENKIRYYGIDPIPLPETKDFCYVRGLAEYIPFDDNTFSHITVLSSLDHFFETDTFLKEVTRVLKNNGKFHVLQCIHEVNGAVSAIKMLAHVVKDTLEKQSSISMNLKAQKHISEFKKSSLIETISNHFEILSVEEYCERWYFPKKMFLTMRSIQRQG